MKKITLKEAYALLENCAAVIIDGALVLPNLSPTETHWNNEWLFLEWGANDGLENCVGFIEDDNQEVVIDGAKMILTEKEDKSDVLLEVLVKADLERLVTLPLSPLQLQRGKA